MINKYQAGGFLTYRPLPIGQEVEQPPATINSQQQTQQAATTGLSDDIVKAMLGNGITNDVIAFRDEVDGAFMAYNNLSDLEKSTQFGMRLRNKMKGDIGALNGLKRNKAALDEALTKIKANNADSDFAVTRNGIIVKDNQTGLVGEVSHSEYANKYKSDPRFKMLTNAELVNEREYNRNLVNDTKSLEALNNAIGVTKVKSEVLDVLAKLGSESRSQSSQMVTLHDPKSTSAGARALIRDGIEGYYKLGQSSSEGTNVPQLKLAIETMWINLSDNAKSLLKARAIEQGATGSQIEELARQNAISILSPSYTTEQSSSMTVDFDSGMTTASNKGGEDDLKTDTGVYTMLGAGAGDPSVYEFNDNDGNVTKLNTITPGALQIDGKNIGATSIRDLMPNLGNLINPNSVFIGGEKLSQKEQMALVYSGGRAHRARIPVTYDPNTNTAAPDMQLMATYNKTMSELARNANAPATTKESIIRNAGMTPTRDKSGNIVPSIPTRDYMIFDGEINDETKSGLSSNNKLVKVSDNERDKYKAIYKYGSATPGKSKELVAGAKDLEGWFTDTWLNRANVYRGTVMMEIMPEVAVSSVTADQDRPRVSRERVSLDNLGGGANNRARLEAARQEGGVRYGN